MACKICSTNEFKRINYYAYATLYEGRCAHTGSPTPHFPTPSSHTTTHTHTYTQTHTWKGANCARLFWSSLASIFLCLFLFPLFSLFFFLGGKWCWWCCCCWWCFLRCRLERLPKNIYTKFRTEIHTHSATQTYTYAHTHTHTHSYERSA